MYAGDGTGGKAARRPEAPRWTPVRLAFLALGLLALALGLVGIFVPLLPTTPFLILAAAAFARSSPRLEGWLLAHARFGPPLRAWRARGAISRPAKIASSVGMGLGLLLFQLAAGPPPVLLGGVALLMILVSGWIWMRPA
jgi:uncharacterized membrane protein YbaN (DUF454 family)